MTQQQGQPLTDAALVEITTRAEQGMIPDNDADALRLLQDLLRHIDYQQGVIDRLAEAAGLIANDNLIDDGRVIRHWQDKEPRMIIKVRCIGKKEGGDAYTFAP